MFSLTAFNFGSQGIRFEQRGNRVWGCLTDMAEATNKLGADYLRLKSTTGYLQGLMGSMGIPIDQLIVEIALAYWIRKAIISQP
jgi:hypothetical protein